MADDRHAKPTSAMSADELARLRQEGERERAPARAERPTSKLAQEDLAGLLNMSDVIVGTKPAADDEMDESPLDLEARDRKTQRMRAKHFQMLVRDGVTDTLPLSPDGIRDGASDRELDPEQRAQRVAGLPRAQTVEYSDELREQLTAEAGLAIPVEPAGEPVAAAPPSTSAAIPSDDDAPIVLEPKRPSPPRGSMPLRRFEADEAEPVMPTAPGSGTGMLVAVSLLIVAVVMALAVYALR